MIIEGLIDLVVALVVGVLDLIPSMAPPAWLDDAAGYLSQLFGYVDGMGAWIPLDLAFTVLGAVLTCVAAGFLIKVIRLVLSLVSGGGGSAA